jgi:hypothetical protein
MKDAQLLNLPILKLKHPISMGFARKGDRTIVNSYIDGGILLREIYVVDDDDDIESEDNLSCGMMPYLSVVPVGSTGDSFIVSAVTTGVTMICALMIIVSATFASITTKTKSTKSA